MRAHHQKVGPDLAGVGHDRFGRPPHADFFDGLQRKLGIRADHPSEPLQAVPSLIGKLPGGSIGRRNHMQKMQPSPRLHRQPGRVGHRRRTRRTEIGRHKNLTVRVAHGTLVCLHETKPIPKEKKIIIMRGAIAQSILIPSPGKPCGHCFAFPSVPLPHPFWSLEPPCECSPLPDASASSASLPL